MWIDFSEACTCCCWWHWLCGWWCWVSCHLSNVCHMQVGHGKCIHLRSIHRKYFTDPSHRDLSVKYRYCCWFNVVTVCYAVVLCAIVAHATIVGKFAIIAVCCMLSVDPIKISQRSLASVLGLTTSIVSLIWLGFYDRMSVYVWQKCRQRATAYCANIASGRKNSFTMH